MHAPVTNIETQVLNERRLVYVENDLINVYYSLFKWNNLPYENQTICDQVSRYIEYLFGTYERPAAFLDESKGLIFGYAAGDGGRTWYGDYVSYTITNQTDTFNGIDRARCAVTRPNPLGTPILLVTNFYATMIWQCERAIFLNLRGQNTPLIVQAPKGQELTYANAYEQIAGYKPVIFARKDYGVGDEATFHYFQPAPYIAGNLMQLYQQWYGEFYNMCGLEARTNIKNERLVAAEVNANTDPVAARLATLINARADFRDQINELTGLNIDFEFMPEGVIDWRYSLRMEDLSADLSDTDAIGTGGESDGERV